MKHLLFLLLTLLHLPAAAHPYDAIINLGGDCQVAYQLSTNNLRAYALPFDSFITPPASLCAILKKNFEGFLQPANFELVINETYGSYILDRRYDVRIIHEFKLVPDFLNEYEDFATKFERRIARLLELIHTSEYPLFIRKNIAKEQTLELKNLLIELRNQQPFLLVVLDTTEEMELDWHEECIRNFYLKQLEPYSWKGDSTAWKEIFNALDLLPAAQ